MSTRNVVVLAPMPLELHAIVTAFGLQQSGDTDDAPWEGTLGNSRVTAVHIGMGPPATRGALTRILDADPSVDHVMIAGICGGLDPELEVGTLLNPVAFVDHTSGASYDHQPPGEVPRHGKIVTTEAATLDVNRSLQFFADGFLGVDMESAAVGEVCEARGVPWSVYRCIGDRHFDGLLDERIVAATNPDGSGDIAAIQRLIASDPEVGKKLDQLMRDTTRAARLAAEAAARGCAALDAQDAQNV
jgi:nucleoside phosphorylase